MLEHRIWRGTNYDQSKKRICIVGESHYFESKKKLAEADTPDLTEHVILARQNYDEWLRFHLAVEHAFREGSSFWDEVIFLNFFPRLVTKADSDELVRKGHKSQVVEDARKRFFAILEAERPRKVFVFSRKAWKLMPETKEEVSGQTELDALFYQGEKLRKFERGTYEISTQAGEASIVEAYGLQHPRPYSPALVKDLQRAVDIAFGKQ